MHRPTLGIITLLLGAAGVTWWLWPGTEGDVAAQVVVRAAVILGALWVGLPAIERSPRWLGIALGVVAVILIIRPRLIIWGLVIAVIIGVLGARGRPDGD